MIDSQLLCTFCNKKELTEIVLIIKESAPLSMKKLYVLEKVENPNELMVTYNVVKSEVTGFLPNTILLHRKKETNTLYTINAVNHIIKDANNGILDKTFVIPWNNYRNSLILADGDDVRHIHLEMVRRINL